MAQAAFHHITCAQFFADCPIRLIRLSISRVEPRAITRKYEKRDNPVMISSDRPSDRAFSSTFVPAILERQHRDPETFVSTARRPSQG